MALAWSNAVAIDQTTDGTTNRVFVGNFPATFAADGVRVTTAPALGAGGSGAIGWFSQIDNDIQTLNITGGQGNSNTLGILARMTDGTHVVRTTAVVKIAADASIADGAQTQQRMDNHGRLRVMSKNKIDPWTTYLKLYGSVTTAATTDTLITNANSAGGNYPANAIVSTIAANRTGYLKKIFIGLETQAVDLVVVTIAIAGVKEIFIPIRTSATNNAGAGGSGISGYEMNFDEAYPIPAGSVIAVYVRSALGSTITYWVRLDGKIEVDI